MKWVLLVVLWQGQLAPAAEPQRVPISIASAEFASYTECLSGGARWLRLTRPDPNGRNDAPIVPLITYTCAPSGAN